MLLGLHTPHCSGWPSCSKKAYSSHRSGHSISRPVLTCQAKRGRPKKEPVEPADDDSTPAEPSVPKRRAGRRPRSTSTEEAAPKVVSWESDVQQSIALSSSEEQPVGAGPAAADPDQQQPDQEQSTAPPPGFHRGRALQVRSSEAALSHDEEEMDLGTLGVLDWDAVEAAEEVDDDRVPLALQPKTAVEAEYLLKHMRWERYWRRQWEEDALLNIAYEIYHYQREETYNEFANARAVSAVMADIELEDHQTGRVQNMEVPSWVRTQFTWGPQFDAFNEYVRVNAESMVNKPPPGADDYDVEIMDDVLLLTEDVLPEDSTTQAGVDPSLLPSGLDDFLEGVLPGTGPDNELGQGYLEDMLRDDAEQEEMLEEEENLG